MNVSLDFQEKKYICSYFSPLNGTPSSIPDLTGPLVQSGEMEITQSKSTSVVLV